MRLRYSAQKCVGVFPSPLLILGRTMKCPPMVQEYAVYISPTYDGVRIDELTMCWSEFETMIQKLNVWDAAMIKNNVCSAFNLKKSQSDPVGSQIKRQSCRPTAADDVGAAPPARAPANGDGSFKEIVCVQSLM